MSQKQAFLFYSNHVSTWGGLQKSNTWPQWCYITQCIRMLQCTLHILHQGGLYHMFHIRFYLTFDVTSIKVLKEQQVWPVTFTKRPQRERVLRPDCIKNKNERLNRRFSGLCCRLLSLNISVGISAAPSVSGLTLWFNSGHHGTSRALLLFLVPFVSSWDVPSDPALLLEIITLSVHICAH